MNEQLKKIFIKELTTRINDHKDLICKGHFDELAYKKACVYVVTLEESLEIFNEIYDKLYRNEDEADEDFNNSRRN